MAAARTRIRFRLVLPLLLLAVTALAGCANREEPAPPAPPNQAAGFPVQLSVPGSPPVTLDKRPERIVSLSPAATEMLFAVGAGQQVVAVDSASTYPANAPKTDLSGLSPNPEAIVTRFNPDLVIVNFDTGNKLTDALAKTGVKTWVLPQAATLDDAYLQFAQVGKATGHQAQGDDLARRTRDDLAKIVADTPKPATPLSYYHEVDNTLYTITSATFIGQVYKQFGLVNIADGGDPNAAGGYPQLSAEKILQANPNLIFLADTKCCGQNPQTVAARPGWNTLTAVQKGNIIALDDDVASRVSPRIVDFARSVGDAIAKASKP